MADLKLGICPKCGSADCDCAHETVDGNELSVWSECANCGHQFIEVLELKRVEKWGDRR
jgi:uncharacterized Zn finger protein